MSKIPLNPKVPYLIFIREVLMARKYECDKCHTQFDKSEEIASVTIPHIGRDEIGSDEFTREFCLSCLRALHEFIKPTPRKVRD